jgi:5'-nucleotidase
MMRILLTNDDGIHAPGLAQLARAFEDLGEVWILAPHVERSACGRAVTLGRPIRVHELGPRRLAVEGTPADCVLLACRHFLGGPPDLAISGINQGYNIGEDLDYSGTVAGAAEATLQGAPWSLAVSVRFDADPACVARAARLARWLAEHASRAPLPAGSFLNLNLPPVAGQQIRLTRQGNQLPPGEVEIRIDPRGRAYYWLGNRPEERDPPEDTDRGALRRGFVSLGLVTLARTHPGPWQPPDLEALSRDLEGG